MDTGDASFGLHARKKPTIMDHYLDGSAVFWQTLAFSGAEVIRYNVLLAITPLGGTSHELLVEVAAAHPQQVDCNAR